MFISIRYKLFATLLAAVVARPAHGERDGLADGHHDDRRQQRAGDDLDDREAVVGLAPPSARCAPVHGVSQFGAAVLPGVIDGPTPRLDPNSAAGDPESGPLTLS